MESLHEISKGSFIFEKKLALKPTECHSMVRLFESREDLQSQGQIQTLNGPEIDLDIKNSVDTFVDPTQGPLWESTDELIYSSLALAITELAEIYEAFNLEVPCGDSGYQIQRTPVGGGYSPHIDDLGFGCNRFITALWYLNDNYDGGETEFIYQGISIKPEIGKLILFPPWWTHLHTGRKVTKGKKYICTTWLNYAG